ncbi:MAG: AI-2E family transporter [Proteobacteria bacterium]|nr:AI-2E family transporter [Pseudomonadota bacterium]
MDNQRPNFYLLSALLAGSFVLILFIFRPFLYTLIFAVVFAVVFQPVNKYVVKLTKQRSGLSALITTVFVVTILLVPIVLFGVQILKEAQQLYLSLAEDSTKKAVHDIIYNLIEKTGKFFPAAKELNIDIDLYLKEGLGLLLKHIGDVFSNAAKLIINSFIFLISLYYLFKDGHKLKKIYFDLSPLPYNENELISNKLEAAINSVIKGNLVIALIQGVLSAAGFACFGVPNAMFWGGVTAISALVPGVGTALVFIPAILFLFLTGKIISGFGLLVWGIGVVGMIDNFLRPKLVGQRMQVHPIIILLSVLGGIVFFGTIGFLLGPLAISLFFALFEIYSAIRATQTEQINTETF